MIHDFSFLENEKTQFEGKKIIKVLFTFSILEKNKKIKHNAHFNKNDTSFE